MLQPGRNGGENYTYGMNGMERDDEIKGQGNSYTTPFGQYDPRLGRWLSTDPVTHPQYSPYSAFDNNPIYWSDPSGANSEINGDTDPPKEDPGFESGRGTNENPIDLSAYEVEINPSSSSSSNSGSNSIAAHNTYWDNYADRNIDLQGCNLWNARRTSEMLLTITTSRTINPSISWSDYDRRMEEFVSYYSQYKVNSTWTLESGGSWFVTERPTIVADMSISEAYDNYVKTTLGYKDHYEFEMIKWSAISGAVSMMSFGRGFGKIPGGPRTYSYTAGLSGIKTSLINKSYFVDSRGASYFTQGGHYKFPAKTNIDIIRSSKMQYNFGNKTWRFNTTGFRNGKFGEYQLGIRPDGGIMHSTFYSK